ncbi:cell wall elongation regulator TseB-like domain-containing protein [Paenibacillus abyssi]|uniref:Cell wall elongation regulator TseB-like domain-containing protein n=1 Tax=Paenibacillus abyssi TaxID=1340531 RepID=A0A917CI38_9BACL|nr:DUF5590 domain-containing protein [Paenibacillus abyssi]GGF89115.1 hypothetical protein GCM10010916_03020 [Paenibacillus abyssi]
MSPLRWTILGVILAMLLFLALNLYYRSIQSGEWTEQRRVESIAMESTELTKVKRIDKHVWDSVSWVLQGTDAEQQELFVWVTNDTAEAVPASAGLSKAQIKAAVTQSKPDIDIIRILPGLLNGERVWEVYYSRDENVRKYYYEFYRFADGSFVTIFNLPSKFADGTE